MLESIFCDFAPKVLGVGKGMNAVEFLTVEKDCFRYLSGNYADVLVSGFCLMRLDSNGGVFVVVEFYLVEPQFCGEASESFACVCL